MMMKKKEKKKWLSFSFCIARAREESTQYTFGLKYCMCWHVYTYISARVD